MAGGTKESAVLGQLADKYEQLRHILADTGGLLIAYSGGVDSTLLLKVAVDVLGDRVLAVTARSETYPSQEVEEAIALAHEMGARQRVIHTEELQMEEFASNPPERCFYCKSELFGKLLEIARQEGLAVVADGSNVDDTGDFRPGMKAGAQLGIRSPLREAGLTKADVRELSRQLGLPTWDKPSFACLASRFPYGHRISREELSQVAAAEQVLRDLGVRQARVRHYGETARIEVDPDDFDTVMKQENRARVISAFHQIGYLYVTLDLEGYRTGSMNAPLLAARECPENPPDA
jgi:uncharacterized protein